MGLLCAAFQEGCLKRTQYKIEACLTRVARSLGYVLLSSSMLLTSMQNPMDHKPLICEPPKQYFADPVAVFDFQSLYPSIMISHNICYSTCLGKLGSDVLENGEIPIGFSQNDLSFNGLKMEDLLVLPNDVVFVKKHIRKGVLPKMLEEFLLTRIFLKRSIKDLSFDLGSRLENQQKSLKLFMNTTFGYTGAGFSGRMPMIELADAVVAIARQIVAQSISIIESLSQNFKVIYGDTDSIFVLMKGETQEKCFEWATLITKKITECCPNPIELKFEKVYKPSIYYSKKRYCGYKYDSLHSIPEFEAKGIETIRRDSSTIVQKLLKDFTVNLFKTQDLSLIRFKLDTFCSQVLNNNIDMFSFIINKKFRLRDSKVENLPKILNKTNKDRDCMDYFLNKERVQLLVIQSSFTSKLKETVN